MNVREFQETFSPWFDVVTKKFQGSFSEDYDINILAFLHENIDKEIKIVFSSTDKSWAIIRAQTLYNVLTYLYEHILWKLRKEDFPNTSLSCVKLLSQLIKTGLLLTYGLTKCEYVDRILTAIKLFTGKPALLYDALLLVNGLKKLHHEPYSVILRCVLKTDHKEITDPLLYMEIILLFRRLLALSDSSDKTLYSLAKKMKPPSNLISWLVSLNVNGSISFLKLLKHKKILRQLMKKNIPEPLLKTVRHMILRSYYFEESCNRHKEMTVSGNNTSDLFITDTSSPLVMQEIQPVKSSSKSLKKINSKRQGEHRIKKSTKGLVSANKEVCDKKTKQSTVSKADRSVFYIDNFSNLVIENEQSDSLQESDAVETHFISNLAAQTSRTVSANIEECKNTSKKRRKSKCIPNTSLHNEELSEHIENEQTDSLQESDAIQAHFISNLAAQTSKTVSTNIEKCKNASKKRQKSKHIPNTSLHNKELNEQSDSLQESDTIKTNFISNLTAQTLKTVSANIEECKSSSKKRRKSKHIPNASLHNEELNEHIENEQSDSLQESDAIQTHFISNVAAQTSKTVPANIEKCKNSSKKRRKSKHIHNASLHKELKISEVEIINLVDTDSSDNVTDVPAKKSKKEYEIDRFSGRKETSGQHIPSKRDYSENESLEYSGESEITNVKHRKKIKYTDDKIVDEYSLENCNISSESNFENLGITPNEIEKPSKNSSDKSVDEEDITFVAEVIRNARKPLDISKINKQNSIKYTETSEKLQNVADKDDSAFIIDNNESCDHQTALLQNQIPSIQTSLPPKLPNSYEDSKKSDQNSDDHVEVAENKEASSKLSTEDMTHNTSNHSTNYSTDENTNITPKKEQTALSSIIEANQDSSPSSPSSDTHNCNIHKAVETHIEKEKLSSAQLSPKNELTINENLIVGCTKGDYTVSKSNLLLSENDTLKDKSLDVHVKCNDSINPCHSLDKSVEDSHDELSEMEPRFKQASNKESEISYKCSDNDSTEKVISLSSENSPASKEVLEKENKLSPSNISKSQKISDSNPKVAFQSDVPCNKFDCASPSVNINDVKHIDRKNSSEVIKEIEIPNSSNISSSTMDVIPFVEVNKNSHDTSKDDSICNNLPKQSLNSSLVTKNKELIAEDANSQSSSPLSGKYMQGNSALSIAPSKEIIQKDKGQILPIYDNDKDSNFKDSGKELSNEEAVNSKNCLSTDNISENFNQSVNEVALSVIAECENIASKDEVKYLEKTIPQIADSSTNSSKLSELSDSNNKDFVNSSAKNTGEAISEINTKCKISEIGVKQTIKNSPSKVFTSGVKCSQRSNNTEKIVSAATPSISSKTNEKVFEKSLQEDSCLPGESSNQSSLVTLQNDEIIENVLPNLTDTVPKNNLKSEKIAVNVLQHGANSDSLLQDHADSESIVKDLVTESSIPNNSSNVPQNDKKPENIIQNDSVGSASQNEACIPLQEDAKFENVFQEDDAAKSSSHLNPEIVSMSFNDTKSDNILHSGEVETTCQNEGYNRSQDDAKSEDNPQKEAVTENYSQQDTETVSMSQDDKKSENIVEGNVKVETSSQNDMCVSQDDTKTKNILEEDLVTESSSQNDVYVSQDDSKTKNILEEDLVVESSSQEDPNSLNVPQDDKKCENIVPGDSAGSTSQNESYIPPQGDTESGNIFQEEKIAKCRSQIDQEIDSGSQEDKIVENALQDVTEVESTYQNEAYSLSPNTEKSENNLNLDVVVEKSSNDTKAISVPQKDKNSENKVHVDLETESTYQNDDPRTINVSQINKNSETVVQCDAEEETVLQNNVLILSDDTKSENLLQEDLAAESSTQNDSYADNVTQDDKKSEDLLQGGVEVVNKSQKEVYSVSHKEAKPEKILHGKVVVESSLQSVPNTNNGSQEGEKSENIFQSDTEGGISTHTEAKPYSQSQKSTESETISQTDTKVDSLTQDKPYAHILSDDAKSENLLQEDLAAESSTQNDSYADNVTQDDKKSEDLLQGGVEVVKKSQKEVYSVSHKEAKPEKILHGKIVVESSLQSVPNTNNGSQEGEKSENIFQSDTEGGISTHTEAKPYSQSQKNTESETISQTDTKVDSLTQDKPYAHILSDDAKSENLLQEDLAAESSTQNDSYADNVTQDDKKSEDLLQGGVEVVKKSQKEVYSVSHKEAKPEKILHGKIVVESSLQSVPNTNNGSQEGEKSENIFQSDTEGVISTQNEAKPYSQSQKNTESEIMSQTDTKVDSLPQDKPQSINKLQVIKEAISGCPSNTVQCDIPNLTNKTVVKDNLSSYSVLITRSSSNICDGSKNVERLPCTKDSVFTPETDSEEIDVVNISNESESEAGITETECSTCNADAIKEFPSVAENKSNSKSVKDKQLSKESIGKNPLKSMPKALLSEYTPHFCKNKDYVSFSDISLQNKNKNIILDSGLKSPNPISNFSLAATAEIFCEYRNDILHGDKTDILSRDDVLSNTHLSDFTKSPSLSSSGSDEEFDSPTYSSTEDNLTNETEKTCDDKTNTVADKTSDSSSSPRNNSCPASENETDDKGNVQNENECMKPSTSDEKEPNERVLVRQSLRLQIKAEAKNKVCLDENPEADKLSDKESKSPKELNPEIDESSHKESKSPKELNPEVKVADSVSHEISSPKSNSIPCDDIISSSASPNKNLSTSEDKTSSQKSVSTKSISVSKRKPKVRAKDYVSPPKGYSLRHQKSRKLMDDSSNLGIDLTKLKLGSPSSMSTRSKSSTKDIKFAKLLTSELNSQKSSDSNELTLPTKRETRSSSAKTEPDATQNTPGYNLRTRTSIIAPGKLNI